jgi:hypothetical protein
MPLGNDMHFLKLDWQAFLQDKNTVQELSTNQKLHALTVLIADHKVQKQFKEYRKAWSHYQDVVSIEVLKIQHLFDASKSDAEILAKAGIRHHHHHHHHSHHPASSIETAAEDTMTKTEIAANMNDISNPNMSSSASASASSSATATTTASASASASAFVTVGANSSMNSGNAMTARANMKPTDLPSASKCNSSVTPTKISTSSDKPDIFDIV